MPSQARYAKYKAVAEKKISPRPIDEQPLHGWFNGQTVVIHKPGTEIPWALDTIARVSTMNIITTNNGVFRIRASEPLVRNGKGPLETPTYLFKITHPRAEGVYSRIRENLARIARRDTANEVVNQWIASGSADDFYSMTIKLGRLQYAEHTERGIITELGKSAEQ